MFKPKETNQSVVNLFLNNIQAVECEDQMRNLIKLFSMQEIWDAVISFKSDKAPGPDGISVEFYQECFQVIKYDLRKVLNLQKQQKTINQVKQKQSMECVIQQYLSDQFDSKDMLMPFRLLHVMNCADSGVNMKNKVK